MSEQAQRPIQVLIVDDEALARARLRRLVESCAEPAAQVLGEAADADAASALLERVNCDCVLLDIHMPGTDGLALARAWRERPQPPAVVFVTAYSEHAVEAFDVEAIDYLTKPVRAERLVAALRKVQARRPSLQRAASAPSAVGNNDAGDAAFVVHARGRIERVPLHEVLYIKAELKYLTLATAAHHYILDGSLNDIEQRHGAYFLRIHRSVLVARRVVRALERTLDDASGEIWLLRLHGCDERLPVSRRQLNSVRAALAGSK